MKINETLYPSFDQEAIEQARHGEAELIAKMKSEFEDFFAQTRERLRLVSESLSELDRRVDQTFDQTFDHDLDHDLDHDFDHDFDYDPIESSGDSEAGKTDQTSTSTSATEQEQDDPSEPVGSSLVQDDRADSSQGNVETNTETDNLDIWPDDVWQSSDESDGKESASKDASFPASRPAPTKTGANGSAQQHPHREIPEAPRASGGDEDTDPFERLNAIKERLARQIEKS